MFKISKIFLIPAFAALVFVGCGSAQEPQLGKRSTNAFGPGSNNAMASGGAVSCDLVKKTCPEVRPEVRLASPASPVAGQSYTYEISFYSSRDSGRKFKAWLMNGSTYGISAPGPSSSGIIKLSNTTFSSTTVNLKFLVRDMDRCSLSSDPSACQYQSTASSADYTDVVLPITLSPGSGSSVTSSTASSSGYSDSDIMRACEEKWRRESGGSSSGGFDSLLPGIISGVGTAISGGDITSSITGILGGVIGSVTGGSSGSKASMPSTVEGCKSYLGI